MLTKYQGCILGAVLGDALAMPNESAPCRISRTPVFSKAYKGHPNQDLFAGQYTDDGQIILIAARNLVEGKFSRENYVKELLRTYNLNKFRYPDGATLSACKKMETAKKTADCGVFSDSAGCLSLAVPFALGYADKKEMAQELVSACILTQTHPAAHAGTLGLALCLKKIAETGSFDEGISDMRLAAQHMEPNLAAKIDEAILEERRTTPVEYAINIIGTTSSVYHTLPMAVFLCKRMIKRPSELLAVAASIGGNCGTIAMICGAVCGMLYGPRALPENLLPDLERAGIFAELGEKLYFRAYPPVIDKIEEEEEPEAEAETEAEAEKEEGTDAEKEKEQEAGEKVDEGEKSDANSSESEGKKEE
ncbi:MAG TPA: ADP-ribosylglycohydrolase family protein [Methanocorpusculum sp.]|nr:ADP-ribosylglycohydrolase family protein [Methanocorpusculum sp.]